MLKQPKIVIDSNEAMKVPRVAAGLKESGVQTRVEPLGAGDYVVLGDPPVVVERKTPFDLVGSVRSGRLWSELEKLNRVEDGRPLVLIEGSVSLAERFTEWTPTSICGVLNSILFDWRVPTVTVPSQKWTVIYLSRLAKKLAESGEPSPHPLVVKAKAESPQEYSLMMIEGLKGVSAVKARALLSRFKTVKGVVNANASELKSVEGVGPKIATDILEIANYEWGGD